MQAGEHILQTEGSDLIRNLVCNLETSTLSFSLVNTVERTYSLKKASVFNLPVGSEAMRFSLNGREIRDLPAQCGDTELFAPGDTIDCSVEFVANSLRNRIMIRVGPDEFGRPLANILHFASPYDQAQVQFVCR